MQIERDPAYSKAGEECHLCSGGTMWSGRHEKVCSNCGHCPTPRDRDYSLTYRGQMTNKNDNRYRHKNSGAVVLAGAFPFLDHSLVE